MKSRSSRIVWQYRTPILSLLLAGITLAGCGGGNDGGSNNNIPLTRSALIGTWRRVSTDQNGITHPCPESGYCGSDDAIQLADDNTFTFNMKQDDPVRLTGTWSIVDEKLHLDFKRFGTDKNGDGDFDDPRETVDSPLIEDIATTVSRSTMLWSFTTDSTKHHFVRQ